MAIFEVIGVYKIVPTQESVVQAARYHGATWLLDEQGEFVDEIYWDQLENLSLVEMRVLDEFAPNKALSAISHGEQAPYMEFYCDSTGTRLLSEEEAIQAQERRLCFFLHLTDTLKELSTRQGPLVLPQMTSLPERLRAFAHYLPVD